MSYIQIICESTLPQIQEFDNIQRNKYMLEVVLNVGGGLEIAVLKWETWKHWKYELHYILKEEVGQEFYVAKFLLRMAVPVGLLLHKMLLQST